MGFEAHKMLAARLEMLLPSLQLLRARMDVAEPPLERVVVEDRRRAGRLVKRVNDFDPGMDRKGRSEADHHPLVQGDMAALLDSGGDGLEREQKPAPRRPEPRLSVCDLRLHHNVVAQ